MPSVASSVALANLSPYVDGNIVKFFPPQQLPRIIRQRLHFARVEHDHSIPLGTPADVHGKSAWEVPGPSTYRQATTGIHAQAWQASMRRELESLQTRGIWREGYVPRGGRAIATRCFLNRIWSPAAINVATVSLSRPPTAPLLLALHLMFC